MLAGPSGRSSAAAARKQVETLVVARKQVVRLTENFERNLADIERGFRVLKSDLEIAPVYHRLPDRIRAHALICFLALVLYRVMRMRLKAHGSTASPKTALELLRRIQQHRATIGEHTYTGISKTTQEQLDLFAALDLPRP